MARRSAAFHSSPPAGQLARPGVPPNVVLGTDVVVGRGVTFEPHATKWTRLHEGVTVGAHAHIHAGVTVGPHVTIPSNTVVARDVPSDAYLRMEWAACVGGVACYTLAVVGVLVVGFETAAALALASAPKR